MWCVMLVEFNPQSTLLEKIATYIEKENETKFIKQNPDTTKR